MIVIVPDLPFSLLPIVEAVMAKISYWLFMALFHTTGATVLIGTETIFAIVVVVAFLAFIASIAADVRYFLERPRSFFPELIHNPVRRRFLNLVQRHEME